MTRNDFKFNEYLTIRDVSTLPKRRARPSSIFYPRLVDAFLASGEKAVEVNVGNIGRKPATVRAALAKAVKSGGYEERMRVSLIGDEVFLVLR